MKLFAGLLFSVLAIQCLADGQNVHPPQVRPTETPVSATMVASCDNLALLIVLTYKDGKVLRLTKGNPHGFATLDEAIGYAGTAKDTMRYDELCDVTGT